MVLTKRQALGNATKGLSFVCYHYIVFICFRVSFPVACASDVVSNKTGNGIMI